MDGLLGEATTESCVLKLNFEVGASKVGSVYACKSPKEGSVHNTVNNSENAGAWGFVTGQGRLSAAADNFV